MNLSAKFLRPTISVAMATLMVAFTTACTGRDTTQPAQTNNPATIPATPTTGTTGTADATGATATTGDVRVEKDLLGEKQVPANAYYGVQTMRALENFQLSGIPINHYPGFIEGYVMVKLAAARANAAVGALKQDRLDAIEKAGQAILDGKYRDQFPVDWYQGGAGTSTNMNINEVMANVGLEMMGHKKGEYQYLDPHDDLNMSQSTND